VLLKLMAVAAPKAKKTHAQGVHTPTNDHNVMCSTSASSSTVTKPCPKPMPHIPGLNVCHANDTISASILLQPLSYLQAHILHSCSHFMQLCSIHTTYYIFNKDCFTICTIYLFLSPFLFYSTHV